MSTNETTETVDLSLGQEIRAEESMISRRKLIKVGWMVPAVAMVMTPRNVFADDVGSVPPEPPYDNRVLCYSQGYYKNCDPDTWLVKSFDFGSRHYTNFTAQDALKISVRGDPYYQLFRQLVAAKLNQAYLLQGHVNPADPDYIKFSEAIDRAQNWMDAYADQSVSARKAAWASISDDHHFLDEVNSNKQCW